MDLKELLQFIEFENDRLNKHFFHDYSDRERIYSCVVKVMEELGEFCDEILKSQGKQRKEKMDGVSREDLSEEFADVIITALLLGNSLNIKVEEALKKKIEKIKSRDY